MTQALLNNLNVHRETSIISHPTTSDADKFGTLFQKKTKQSDNCSLPNSDVKTKCGKKDIKTMGSLKKTVNSALADFKNILQETTQDVIRESALDLGLIKDVESLAQNIGQNIGRNFSSVESNESDISGIQPVNINQEDSISATSQIGEIMNDIEQAQEVGSYATVTSQIITNQYTPNQIEYDTESSLDKGLNAAADSFELENFLDNLELNTSAEENVILSDIKLADDAEAVKVDDIFDEEILKELNIETIETDCTAGENNSDTDFMQNQSPEEQGVKALIQGHCDYKEIKPEMVVKTPNILNGHNITTEKIIEQIAKQLENMHNTSRVNIILNPEALGKVSLQIINTAEGLSAQFTVTTQEARDLIMKGLDGLKDNLLSQGVNVDNVSVKLNDTQRGEYKQDWTEQDGSRGGHKHHKEHHHKHNEQVFEQMLFGLDGAEEDENV